MKKTILLVSILVFMVQCNSPKSVEISDLQTELSIKKQVENGAFLVDVRSPAEFADGSFPGAVNIPLEEVESRVGEFKNKPSVVVFCRTGNRSSKAIEILENNGIKSVTNGINLENMEKETK
ncbi:rhodanese-like domain-containing protein [Frigoriflavimonas asaccharolytica]|uniref:Rhodanese-related sulfurtransferase n=1 Tax=Frigoriflavimonas asaccharolytica TaxID=2735899 RepID=A0A8J8KCB4_9FLAO|nr:rhodanese-like domain-containing protein [Frigoriflavimonas asaccharolytica]NRS93439.1 rhodanese-related sulfurtransferase [Frigoriflavimonas asaccharolytica]